MYRVSHFSLPCGFLIVEFSMCALNVLKLTMFVSQCACFFFLIFPHCYRRRRRYTITNVQNLNFVTVGIMNILDPNNPAPVTISLPVVFAGGFLTPPIQVWFSCHVVGRNYDEEHFSKSISGLKNVTLPG
jgi:hypothetical protein